MPECRFRCRCGTKFTHAPCFWVKCPSCAGVQLLWVNSAEVVAWLMEHDPEYARSYGAGGQDGDTV